jgi:hypothetical protein
VYERAEPGTTWEKGRERTVNVVRIGQCGGKHLTAREYKMSGVPMRYHVKGSVFNRRLAPVR